MISGRVVSPFHSFIIGVHCIVIDFNFAEVFRFVFKLGPELF